MYLDNLKSVCIHIDKENPKNQNNSEYSRFGSFKRRSPGLLDLSEDQPSLSEIYMHDPNHRPVCINSTVINNYNDIEISRYFYVCFNTLSLSLSYQLDEECIVLLYDFYKILHFDLLESV